MTPLRRRASSACSKHCKATATPSYCSAIRSRANSKPRDRNPSVIYVWYGNDGSHATARSTWASLVTPQPICCGESRAASCRQPRPVSRSCSSAPTTTPGSRLVRTADRQRHHKNRRRTASPPVSHAYPGAGRAPGRAWPKDQPDYRSSGRDARSNQLGLLFSKPC
jgi:hypothetical protein